MHYLVAPACPEHRRASCRTFDLPWHRPGCGLAEKETTTAQFLIPRPATAHFHHASLTPLKIPPLANSLAPPAASNLPPASPPGPTDTCRSLCGPHSLACPPFSRRNPAPEKRSSRCRSQLSPVLA